jgi:hypothetical protein
MDAQREVFARHATDGMLREYEAHCVRLATRTDGNAQMVKRACVRTANDETSRRGRRSWRLRARQSRSPAHRSGTSAIVDIAALLQ